MEFSMNEVTAYTDGGSNDLYQGGWAFYIPGEIECSGYVDGATNNEMELRAMIELLKYLGKSSHSTIYSDSTYVVKGLTEWSIGWRKYNWIKSDGNPVANKELWQELTSLYDGSTHRILFVKGHKGEEGNETCDRLVQLAKNMKLPRITNSYSSTLGVRLQNTTDFEIQDSSYKINPDEILQEFQNSINKFYSLTEYDKRILAPKLASILAPLNYQLGTYQ